MTSSRIHGTFQFHVSARSARLGGSKSRYEEETDREEHTYEHKRPATQPPCSPLVTNQELENEEKNGQEHVRTVPWSLRIKTKGEFSENTALE